MLENVWEAAGPVEEVHVSSRVLQVCWAHALSNEKEVGGLHRKPPEVPWEFLVPEVPLKVDEKKPLFKMKKNSLRKKKTFESDVLSLLPLPFLKQYQVLNLSPFPFTPLLNLCKFSDLLWTLNFDQFASLASNS